MKGVILIITYLLISQQILAQTLPVSPDTSSNGPIFPITNYVFMGRVDYEYWIPRKQLPLKVYKNLPDGSFLIENSAPGENLNYKNGLLDGHYIYYWGNGNPQFELTINEGLVQGPLRQWYENGELFVQAYIYDCSLYLPNILSEAKKCQAYITESGSTIYSYSYVDIDTLTTGFRMGVYEEHIAEPSFDGLYKCYWPNSVLMEKSYYVEGKRVGYTYYFDETGMLTMFEFFGNDGHRLSYGIKQADGSIKTYTEIEY